MNTLSLLTTPRPGVRLAALLPGLLLTGLLTWLALQLSEISGVAALGLGALTLAILAGIVAGNTFYPRLEAAAAPGVTFAKQRLLRLGIILYGFRLTFQQVASVGTTGWLIDFLTLSSTFLLACWLGRRVFKLDRDTTWLIGAGSSICGAAAVMATGPVTRADAGKSAIAVATVVLYGTLAIFVYPWLCHWLQAQGVPVSAQAFGIYTGSTVHEVAQVVAVGHAIGPEAENAAVIAKMMRVMMLAPFLLLLSGWLARQAPVAGGARVPVTVPWFALAFIGATMVNSLHLLPPHAVQALLALDNLLLAMAMAALGLTTRFSALKQAGVRPLLLGGLLFLWLMAGGAGINLLVNALLG
ncbi:YeiH family putative sulfate export transporter [Chimaeribacter coloradensis]|uniref:YeiH family putative sulfate export transporter n=1 Tax=Chimaeribacter coloradensis TaxID=2060068 RepID=A0A2N5DWX9_9GAMM|nr:YeiH family putative sulfate export transporter [Chimaeribacter coloradensis]PLR31742.1 YeiH family putative sulfate export transporter [Chimaeribacter coloradensis]